jgi:hypothetical protein
MVKYIHAFLDWDNVGTFGLEKIYKKLKSNPDYVPDIFLIGIMPQGVQLTGNLLCQTLDLANNNQMTYMFHDQKTKNATDFYLCLELGRFVEKWMNDTDEHYILILSGDAGFDAVPVFIYDIIQDTNLEERFMVDVWNVHSNSNNVVSEASEVYSENEQDHDSFETQSDYIPVDVVESDQEIEPFIQSRPSTQTIRERITRYYDKSPRLNTILNEWKRLQVPFPIQQKKLLKHLKNIYGDSREGRQNLRRILGDQHQGNKSLMMTLTSFLKRHPHHFSVEGKKKVVSLIPHNI